MLHMPLAADCNLSRLSQRSGLHLLGHLQGCGACTSVQVWDYTGMHDALC